MEMTENYQGKTCEARNEGGVVASLPEGLSPESFAGERVDLGREFKRPKAFRHETKSLAGVL